MSLDVSVESVSKMYGGFAALKPTSLNIKNGEFFTILGPSGSGKTTLLKLISGFELPSEGTVRIGSQDVTFAPPHKRGIGMVFQNYALFPHMTVKENIAFPLRMRKIPKGEVRKKVDQVLDLVQLGSFKERYPNQLSGGQRQRVALARAVVFDPPVLLLDEPLGALDKQLRTQMQIEIKKLQQELKITTISVTHDQEEALTMSTKICIISNGEIEQVGTPRQIYEQPQNRFVADFIGETNLIEGQVIGWDQDVATIKSLKGEIFQTVSLHHQLTQITFAIRPEKVMLVDPENPPDNTFRGLVKEIIYIGESSRCHIVTEKGEMLHVKVGPKEIPFIREGQELLIGWELNEGRILLK